VCEFSYVKLAVCQDRLGQTEEKNSQKRLVSSFFRAPSRWNRAFPAHGRWLTDAALQENTSVFEFFLCLSRACLGKMIIFIYKWLKTPFSHLPRGEFAVTKRPVSMVVIPCGKHPFSQLLSLFPCLSRACLGKKMILSIKLAQKGACFAPRGAPLSDVKNHT
jgi:hypothetical protein